MKKINFLTVAAISAATVFSSCDALLDQISTKEIPISKTFTLEALVTPPETDGVETDGRAANTQFFPFTGQEVLNLDSLELGDDVQYLPNLQEIFVDDVILSVSSTNPNGSVIDVVISSPTADDAASFALINFNDSINNDETLNSLTKAILEKVVLNEENVELDWQGQTDAPLNSKITFSLSINGRLKVKLLQQTTSEEESTEN